MNFRNKELFWLTKVENKRYLLLKGEGFQVGLTQNLRFVLKMNKDLNLRLDFKTDNTFDRYKGPIPYV